MIRTIIAIIFMLSPLCVYFVSNHNITTVDDVDNIIKPPINDELFIMDEWDLLIEAMVFVESSGNHKAIGKDGDYGVLQITPIYVEDVNRILKEDKYSHKDAFDSLKSIDMFNIFQNHYNPNKNINKAIKLHNPRAEQWYTDRILNKLTKDMYSKEY